MVRQSRFREIAEDLRQRLIKGDFPVGSTLPSVNDLAALYRVPSRNTVRGALAVLAEEGLVESIQGRGTYVRALPASDPDAGLLADLHYLQEALAGMQTTVTRMLRRLQ